MCVFLFLIYRIIIYQNVKNYKVELYSYTISAIELLSK